MGLQYLISTSSTQRLTDHPSTSSGRRLGSTVAVTNSSGTLTSQQRYLPFGAPRAIPNSPILGTDFTYTGQRLLDSGMGGIMDYRARFFSPSLGRFLQPDTIIPDQSNPQSWNRFSYVENRPVNFNDPSGHTHLCGVLIPEEDCQDENPISPADDGDEGENPDSPSVLTEEQLEELGIRCGENVEEITCQLYTDPSSFNLQVYADFPDWLYQIINPNYGTAFSCLVIFQGCIFEGLIYTLHPNTSLNPDGGVDWNRDVEIAGFTLPLFHANWQTGSFRGAPAAIERFPLRDGKLGYTTVYLRPAAINRGITWTSNTASYGELNMSLPGTITFTTQATGLNSIQTVGSFTLPGGIVIGQIIINGILK